MNNATAWLVFWTAAITVWGVILISIWLRPVP